MPRVSGAHKKDFRLKKTKKVSKVIQKPRRKLEIVRRFRMPLTHEEFLAARSTKIFENTEPEEEAFLYIRYDINGQSHLYKHPDNGLYLIPAEISEAYVQAMHGSKTAVEATPPIAANLVPTPKASLFKKMCKFFSSMF